MSPVDTEGLAAPHKSIEPQDDKERFLVELFDSLWVAYRERVGYVRTYERVVREHGGAFVNDHIAFRTLGGQNPFCGIAFLGRLFEALGYVAAGCYQFPATFLSSVHYQHPNPRLPKLFITELQSWRFSKELQKGVAHALEQMEAGLSDDDLAGLWRIDKVSQSERQTLLGRCTRVFDGPTWRPPERSVLKAVNDESQVAAWVLIHGFRVNHFTALVNSHGVAALDDIEKTVAALKKAGVPMKDEIEGERGSKLRQTATHAVKLPVFVLDHGMPVEEIWTYAYFEIAERGEVADPESGRRARFEGFLGPQAKQLFEMTKM